ncbi:lymphocyte antigen 75-like, partial [Electrophorus electricus]|uniref:lymphocyte antigen 75-like n=1 Tax=Electrophorus electricus TaxID=8005 RepID=UPI0015D0846B
VTNKRTFAALFSATVVSAAVRSRLRTFHIIGDVSLTQSEAQAVCRRNYTDLVTVHSEEEDTVLVNLTKMVYPSTAWIGLYRNQPSCKWSNGDAVTFRNMTGNMTCGTGANCVAMKADGGWETFECTEKRDFMCYKYVTSTDGIRSMLSYHLVLQKMAWYDAQQYCREIYKDLVSIKDQEQNEEVKLKGKNSIMSFWIGLLCDDWEWADGGLSGYRNWRGNNSQPFSCVELVKEEWSPAECNDPAYALCYSTSIHVSDDSMSWERALDYCKENNRTGLLCIDSDLDQKEMESELRRNKVSGPVDKVDCLSC